MVKFGNGSRVLASIAATLLLGASATAMAHGVDPKGTESAATETTKAPEAQPKPRRYCIERQSTGTIFSGKVCKSREQWLKQGFDPAAPQP